MKAVSGSLKKYPQRNGVYILTDPMKTFEENYLKLRRSEGRVFTDEEVSGLPVLPANSQHYREFQIRANTLKYMLQYLKKKPQACRIMDIGCGNGWFAHHLTGVTGTCVLAVDINLHELQQGARVFPSDTLSFAYADIFEAPLPEQLFDIITLNAVIQYFSNLSILIERAMRFLNPGGEIHILDSPIYPKEEIAEARQRSAIYFDKAGFPEMASYYYHHSRESLKEIAAEYMFMPCRNSVFRRIFHPRRVFPHIRIIKPKQD